MYVTRPIAAAAILTAFAFLYPGPTAAQEPQYVGSVRGDTATAPLLWVRVMRTGVGITVWDPPADVCDGPLPLRIDLPVDRSGALVADMMVCQTGTEFGMTTDAARALADSIEALALASLPAAIAARSTEVMLVDGDRAHYPFSYTRSSDSSAPPAHRLTFGPRGGALREFTLSSPDIAPILRLAALLREAARLHAELPASPTAH